MRIVENTTFSVKMAPKKDRKRPEYWNWPELVAMVKKVLETGEEVRGNVGVEFYAIVRPNYCRTNIAGTPEEIKWHKVRITLYSIAMTFGVEKTDDVSQPLNVGANCAMEISNPNGIRNEAE